MAKLSDLITALSRLLPLPEQTVAVYARLLREARLLSTGGRGPGAANMTPDDCARLLLAIMAADQVKDAVSAVERFGGHSPSSLDHLSMQPKAERRAWLPLPDSLSFLDEPKNFGETFADLIDAARDGALQSALNEDPLSLLFRSRWSAVSPRPVCSSRRQRMDYTPTSRCWSSMMSSKANCASWKKPRATSKEAMPSVSFTVTQKSILALGELIHEGTCDMTKTRGTRAGPATGEVLKCWPMTCCAVTEIAAFVFGSTKHRRKVYYYATNAKARMPVFRIGAIICARKSTLLEWIRLQEGVR